MTPDRTTRPCRACGEDVGELDVFATAIGARYGVAFCEPCAGSDGERTAELLNIERPTVWRLLLDLGTRDGHRFGVACAELGYYPWDSAARLAAETSAEELKGRRGVGPATLRRVQAALAARGLQLREADAPAVWCRPYGAAGEHLALKPRAELDVGRVCNVVARLGEATSQSVSREGEAATLAGLIEVERRLREYLAGRDGARADAVRHIESRELAGLHAGLHMEDDNGIGSEGQPEN